MTSNNTIGGIYTDPFHSPTTASANIYGVDAPWFGGIRICAKTTPDEFLCIGCDDGLAFWVLKGAFTDDDGAMIEMDFSPKAPGVGLLKCSYSATAGTIDFLDNDGSVGNTWSRLKPTADFDLKMQTKHIAFNDVNGLYMDPSICKPGSFAGIRVVSDRLGKIMRDEICLIGTDDGIDWWAMEGGAFTDKATGAFSVGSLSCICHNGIIKFGDGNRWVKMAVKTDFHSLPKEI